MASAFLPTGVKIKQKHYLYFHVVFVPANFSHNVTNNYDTAQSKNCDMSNLLFNIKRSFITLVF